MTRVISREQYRTVRHDYSRESMQRLRSDCWLTALICEDRVVVGVFGTAWSDCSISSQQMSLHGATNFATRRMRIVDGKRNQAEWRESRTHRGRRTHLCLVIFFLIMPQVRALRL